MNKDVRTRVQSSFAVQIVYDLCNEESWFTGGSTSSYEKMFALVRNDRPVQDIALAIWLCSDAEYLDIYVKLENVLFLKED